MEWNKNYKKTTFVAFLLVLMFNSSFSIVANSSTYTLNDMLQSTTGGMANSTTYDVRTAQHYQQPVGAFQSISFQGFLKWLNGITKEILHGITYTQVCLTSNSTLKSEITLSGDYNNTIENCQFGCNNGACETLETKTNFLYPSIITLIALAFLFIYLSKHENLEGYVPFILFLLSILFISLPFLVIGVVLQGIIGIQSFVDIILSFGTNNLWFFILAILLFVIIMVKGMWEDIRKVL